MRSLLASPSGPSEAMYVMLTCFKWTMAAIGVRFQRGRERLRAREKRVTRRDLFIVGRREVIEERCLWRSTLKRRRALE